MNTTQLLNDIEQLPPEAQHQIEDFVAFIKTRYQFIENKRQPEIIKGDENVDPNDFIGLWKDSPRTLEAIRKDAWYRSSD